MRLKMARASLVGLLTRATATHSSAENPTSQILFLNVDGKPVEDITLMVDPDNNFSVIMKDGAIYKNTLDQSGLRFGGRLNPLLIADI